MRQNGFFIQWGGRSRSWLGLSVSLLVAILLLLPGTALLSGSGMMAAADAPAPHEIGLRINEVVTGNASLLTDVDGSRPDLIELYNPGPDAIDLTGYGLSDDPSVPLKWTFPQHELAPDSYLVVFAAKHPPDLTQAGKEDMDDESSQGVAILRADFGLSKRGDKLSLSDPEGRLLQLLVIDAAEPDIAYGMDASGEFVWWTRATPGSENGGERIRNLMTYRRGCTLTPSREAGFYEAPFVLSLTSDRPELIIRYTLDGSNPNTESPVYEGPIPITDREGEPYRYAGRKVTFTPAHAPAREAVELATVLTAQAFDGETPIGKPLIRTYFVDPLGAQRYAFPVVSLTTDPDHLYDDATGIFVVGSRFLAASPRWPDGSTAANYNQRGREWERPIHMEFIEDGTRTFSQPLGVRTFGGWSRAEPKKSLKLFARDAYSPETKQMTHAFFPGMLDSQGREVDGFRQLVLRNGGNDWNTTLFRDPMMQELADDVTDKQANRPVIVFLNGEYWGIYFLTESLDADWVAAHYGVDADTVGIIANGWELYEGTEADNEDYLALMAYLNQHSLKEAEAFSVVANWVDVEAYLRYQAAQIYFGNLDWPGNNFKMFRVRPEDAAGNAGNGATAKGIPAKTDRAGVTADSTDSTDSTVAPNVTDVTDGRWRPMLYDTDFGFGLYADKSDVTHDTLWMALDPASRDWWNPPWATLLFRRLMENEACRRQFVDIMEESLQTRFSEETVLAQIEKWQETLEPEMAEYANRYDLWRIPDVVTWKYDGIVHLKGYARQRPYQIRQQLARHLGF